MTPPGRRDAVGLKSRRWNHLKSPSFPSRSDPDSQRHPITCPNTPTHTCMWLHSFHLSSDNFLFKNKSASESLGYFAHITLVLQTEDEQTQGTGSLLWPDVSYHSLGGEASFGSQWLRPALGSVPPTGASVSPSVKLGRQARTGKQTGMYLTGTNWYYPVLWN